MALESRGTNESKETWEEDVWKSAEVFAGDCSSFIEELQFSSRQHVSRINPCGRFQDSVLRQLKHLSYLVQISVDNKDDIDFRTQANEFCDYALSNDLNAEELLDSLESTELFLEVTDAEVLYQTSKIIVPKQEILVLSVESLLSELRKKPDLVFDVSPRRFEELVAEIFSRNGYEVELMQQTKDGGKDIIAVSNNMGIPTQYIIESKRYAQNRNVGIEIVQRLYGVKCALHASFGLVVTTSTFSREAFSFASQHPWELSLKGYESLVDWISKSSNSFNTDRLSRYAPKSSG